MIFSTTWTQDSAEEEPEYQKFIQSFKKSYFDLSMLLQVVGDFQKNRSSMQKNGFTISTMRFRVKGKLDKGFSYFFQTNHVNAFSVLDAYFSYGSSSFLTVDMGLMKSPFSKEFSVYAADIDFVNRARIVELLAPKREIGLQAKVWVIDNIFKYSLGMFNGNGFNGNANDNNQFLYTARLAAFPSIIANDGDYLEMGAGIAWSKDENLLLTAIDNTFEFSGERNLYEVDFRMEISKFLFAGEYIYGQFDGWYGEEKGNKSYQGFHLTIGYRLMEKVQFLSRLDNLKLHSPSNNDNQLLLGCNFLPSSVASFQVNYIWDLDRAIFQNNQLLINAQLSI
jgi:hypothetical protein